MVYEVVKKTLRFYYPKIMAINSKTSLENHLLDIPLCENALKKYRKGASPDLALREILF